MALALEDRAMKDDLMVGDTPKALRRKGKLRGVETNGRLWKHSSISEAEGLFNREELAELFIFTLVRNPWDRSVSYYHWLREQSFAHAAVALAKAHDFDGFIREPETCAALKTWPTRRYLTDGAGQERPALCIRLEHLQQDMVPLCAHLGFELVLEWVNRSGRAADWRGYYCAQTRAMVADACAEDIARFGYEF